MTYTRPTCHVEDLLWRALATSVCQYIRLLYMVTWQRLFTACAFTGMTNLIHWHKAFYDKACLFEAHLLFVSRTALGAALAGALNRTGVCWEDETGHVRSIVWYVLLYSANQITVEQIFTAVLDWAVTPTWQTKSVLLTQYRFIYRAKEMIRIVFPLCLIIIYFN